MLSRVDAVQPLALLETMVPAATPASDAVRRMDTVVRRGCAAVRRRLVAFARWLDSAAGCAAPAMQAHSRLTMLRLRFNATLAQLHVFSDALTQRSEHDIGVWLAGLDAFAADAIALPGGFYEPPPLLCFLQPGFSAAIRRARTRLAGGTRTPVGIVQIPRERLVGAGIGASLAHEVGHQAAAQLDLVPSLVAALDRRHCCCDDEVAWRLYRRWISETVADLWASAKLGVGATTGLMAVVSLPRAFVFRTSLDGPHPWPWIRVRQSCAIGRALYPDAQFDALERAWLDFYPIDGLPIARRRLVERAAASLPGFVAWLLAHRPASLRGRSLRQALTAEERSPARLRAAFTAWRNAPHQLLRAAPTLGLAVVAQAGADGRLDAAQEARLIRHMLRQWALDRWEARGAIRKTVTRGLVLQKNERLTVR